MKVQAFLQQTMHLTNFTQVILSNAFRKLTKAWGSDSSFFSSSNNTDIYCVIGLSCCAGFSLGLP